MKQFTCSSQSCFSIEWNDNEKGVCGGGWIFCSGFSSMETTVASSIKQLFQRKDGFSFSCPLISMGSSWLLGAVGVTEGRCSAYILYMLLPWWMTWFGLVRFPPLLLILCVLLPLCCAIRTLQWDTDPSVLQLQSDSELGYMSALLLLLLLFLCYGCVERPEPLLLLPFPLCWISSLISLFPSASLPSAVTLWRKSLFVENTTKRWLLTPPLLIPSIAKQPSPKWKLQAYHHASASRWGAQVLWRQICLTWSSPSSPWLTSYLKLIFV